MTPLGISGGAQVSEMVVEVTFVLATFTGAEGAEQ